MQKKLNIIVRAVGPLLVATLLLGGCGGDGTEDTNVPVAPVDPDYVAPVPFDPIVKGTVIDGETGAAVSGATVQADGVSATTDSSGKFSLTLAVNDHVLLSVSKTGYADNMLVTQAVQSTRTTVLAQLLPVDANSTIDPAVGGTVTVSGSTARVVVSAASLERSDAQPISGLVSVRVTPISPAVSPDLMPGDYQADRPGTGGAASTPSSIESYGALTVTLVDASDAAVEVASGMTATIRIPVATRSTSSLPATVPFFYFDAATGKWIEQGTGTLAGTAPNQYYEGTVSQVGTWAAAQYDDSVTAAGCLQNDFGQRVAGARVVSDGIDYSGTATATTDANGNFSVPMKKGGQAILTAQSGSRYSNSLLAGPSLANFRPTTTCLVVASSSTGMNIRLTWGLRPNDIDSHLYTPSGTHIYYGAKGSLGEAPYAALDVDDLVSNGPEIITVRRLMVGTYQYFVHNYSGTSSPGITTSPTRIQLSLDDDTQLFVPASGEGSNDWWNVFTLTVDAQCAITVTPVNTWSATAPTAPATSSPLYCTPP